MRPTLHYPFAAMLGKWNVRLARLRGMVEAARVRAAPDLMPLLDQLAREVVDESQACIATAEALPVEIRTHSRVRDIQRALGAMLEQVAELRRAASALERANR
jgi:hypothetical protein